MVRKDIKEFLATIPNNVTLVAATKYVNSDGIKELYQAGVKNYGENRVDSFFNKYEELKDYQDISWHFIGHLQRNKAKQVINNIPKGLSAFIYTQLSDVEEELNGFITFDREVVKVEKNYIRYINDKVHF